MSKKVLSLVLALVMVLGTFGTAFAANYPDTVDTVYDGAVDRLSLLEILKGYPDGTFKPENQITRAEFAAVAVRAKGLEDAANAAKGLATGFTDVAPAPAHWAAGYVGTAARLGIVNGVGGGLFAPEAPVKYEEAITMIVRALGYEVSAQTKGGYPYGYLIVANEIGLLDQVKGTQGTPASRGTVAQITDNALEIPKMIQVGFGADAKWVVSGSKEHGDEAEAQYLLHDLGVEEVKGLVTNNFRTKSTLKAKEVEIEGVKYDITESVDTDAVLGVGVTAWAKDDVVFAITLGYTIKQSVGKDIVFDEESQILYDVTTSSDKDKVGLYIADDKYEWANKARIYLNNEKVNAVDVYEDGLTTYGRFVLNEDDEVEFAYLFEVADADSGIVTKVSKTDLDYVNLNADEDVLALDDAEEIYVFNRDLSQASLEDITEDTAVFYWIDEDDNYFIIVSDEKVEGTLEAVRVRDNRLTIEGTNKDADDYPFIFSSDDKEEFDVILPANFDDLEEYVDEEVVLFLNLAGTSLALVTDTDAASSTVYGLATWLTSDRNPVLSVYTAEGKEVDYTFEEKKDIPSEFKTGNYFDLNPTGVYFKLNKDGKIKEDTFAHSNVQETFVKEDDNKYGTIANGNRLYITEDTVVIEAYDDKANDLDPSVIKYANIINKEIKTNNKAIVIREDLLTADGNDDLGLLIFTDVDFTASDDEEYGIVTSDPVRRGSDYRVEIDVHGKGKETYIVSKLSDAEKLRTGDIIEFELDGKGELLLNREVDSRKGRESASVYQVVSSKSNNFITTNKGTYRNTADTVYYSIDKNGDFRSSASSFSRIDKGSVILLMVDDNELMGVLDITAWFGVQTGTPTPGDATGVVTYIDASRLELDKKVTHVINADTKLVKGGVTVAMGVNIVNNLSLTDQVTVKDNVITFVSSAADRAEALKVAAATTAVEKAEASKLAADITAAQTLVDGLATGTAKTNLQARLNAIVLPETDLQKATKAVDKAVASKLKADVDAAQLLVNALPAGADRVAQQARLDAIVVVAPVLYTSVSTTTGKEAVLGSALVPAVKATKTVDTDIVLTAVTGGVAGNNITFAVAQGTGDGVALAINVTGNDIKVTLPTDAAGTAVSVNRDDLVAAINADVNAKALVVATGGTANAAGAVARVALAGGVNEIPAVTAAPAVAQVYTLTITNGVTASGNITVKGVGADETVAVVNGMTAELVANAIATDAGLIGKATTAGYTMSVVGNKVLFTANTAGAVGSTGPAAITVTVQ